MFWISNLFQHRPEQNHYWDHDIILMIRRTNCNFVAAGFGSLSPLVIKNPSNSSLSDFAVLGCRKQNCFTKLCFIHFKLNFELFKCHRTNSFQNKTAVKKEKENRRTSMLRGQSEKQRRRMVASSFSSSWFSCKYSTAAYLIFTPPGFFKTNKFCNWLSRTCRRS